MEDDSYMEYVNFHNLEIEHRMLSVDFEDAVEELVRLSCVLYLNTVLVRGYPVDSAIIQNVLKVHKSILEESLYVRVQGYEDLVSRWAGFEDVLLWVLFIGGYCSYAQTDQEFFGAAFITTAAQLGLETVEQAQNFLSRFFFVNRVHAQKLVEMYRMEGEQK